MPIKIINTIQKLKDVKSGEVFITRYEGIPNLLLDPYYDVAIQDEDEVLGSFRKEERAVEYAEWIEYKIDQKRICTLNHVLYADKDGICNICGKPFNEDF